MNTRFVVAAALLALGAAPAYADSEGNNLAAVERSAGTGVYQTMNYNTTPAQAVVPVTSPQR